MDTEEKSLAEIAYDAYLATSHDDTRPWRDVGTHQREQLRAMADAVATEVTSRQAALAHRDKP